MAHPDAQRQIRHFAPPPTRRLAGGNSSGRRRPPSREAAHTGARFFPQRQYIRDGDGHAHGATGPGVYAHALRGNQPIDAGGV